MYRIDDEAFLRWFCRFAGWPSRYLVGAGIEVTESLAGLEVHITNGLYALLSIAWSRQRASLRTGSSLLTPDDLWGLEETLTIHVGRLLRKHGLTDARGRVIRKGVA